MFLTPKVRKAGRRRDKKKEDMKRGKKKKNMRRESTRKGRVERGRRRGSNPPRSWDACMCGFMKHAERTEETLKMAFQGAEVEKTVTRRVAVTDMLTRILLTQELLRQFSIHPGTTST